jgi:hypothetical protein
MVLPLLLLPMFGREDGTCSMNSDSIPTALVHYVCRALKSCALLDRPLPDGWAGGKDGIVNGSNNNCDASSGS